MSAVPVGVHDVADLLGALDLQSVDEDNFVGRNAIIALPRVFGGQVLAQAIIAAGRTVGDDRTPHSLHAYFLSAGDPSRPIEFAVQRIRDGRTTSNRMVLASQSGRTIASVTVSFLTTFAGVSHQVTAPSAPDPLTLRSLLEHSQTWGGLGPVWESFESVDTRVVPREIVPQPDADDSLDLVWQRVQGDLPDDPLIHTAALAFTSDVMLLGAALVPHGIELGKEVYEGNYWDVVSLDHAMWFHRQVRADDWLLFEQRSPVAVDGRALVRAEIFDPAGAFVCSVVQEGLTVPSPVEGPPARR